MIYLIVGNTGAGKTTYSHQLKEKVGGFLFSIDVWNSALFLPDKKDEDGLAWYLERIDRAEDLMQEQLLQLQRIGIDTILDLGFSKYEHRQKFRDFAQANSIEVELHFLDIPKKERQKRVTQRNIEKGATFSFEVTNENLEFMEELFETPTSEELHNAVIRIL
ncbi:ATP-binding protein [Cellulophaga sp. HaHa_2_1]|uniref:AAA family ATPase n=1 Tax=Cellulophaga sp. HaHa_2_1 TaxID=2749994 RepID=UPI001C4FD300|nr:ATP-binding protein [Cellulophaga sp. HaHa_2_1]QXP52174.1 ATP-binding protein [Cellulophaga sp. HaHa_2_1]